MDMNPWYKKSKRNNCTDQNVLERVSVMLCVKAGDEFASTPAHKYV
jgi:hypothetical protein